MRKHCGKIKYFYDFQSLQLKKNNFEFLKIGKPKLFGNENLRNRRNFSQRS